MLGNAIPMVLLASTLALTGCTMEQKGSSGNEDVKIETPLGGLKVKTNEAVVAAETGLPVYPGATVVKKDKDNGAADIDMSFGSFHLRVKAVSYRTPDAPDKVMAFYRKGLARFGDVIECRDNRPVGTPSKTSEGLTCDHDEKSHVTISNAPEHADVELKAGGKVHQHIVAIEKESGGTKFGLVALDLPSDEPKEGKESN
jgi:hypothetical protein